MWTQPTQTLILVIYNHDREKNQIYINLFLVKKLHHSNNCSTRTSIMFYFFVIIELPMRTVQQLFILKTSSTLSLYKYVEVDIFFREFLGIKHWENTCSYRSACLICTYELALSIEDFHCISQCCLQNLTNKDCTVVLYGYHITKSDYQKHLPICQNNIQTNLSRSRKSSNQMKWKISRKFKKYKESNKQLLKFASNLRE